MNSRDVANNCIQASALDARCKWTRDPATTGVRVMVAVRRSFPIACGLQDRTRSPCVGGVIPTVLDVSSLTCAGWVRSAGDFFVPMPDQRIDAGAVLPRSGVAAPFVKMRVPVCNVPSLGKEKTTCPR